MAAALEPLLLTHAKLQFLPEYELRGAHVPFLSRARWDATPDEDVTPKRATATCRSGGRIPRPLFGGELRVAGPFE